MVIPLHRVFRKYKYVIFLVLTSSLIYILLPRKTVSDLILVAEDAKFNQDLHSIQSLMINEYGNKIHQWSLSKRCERYFDLLYKTQPDWGLKPKIGKDQFKHDNAEMLNDIHILNIFNKCFITSESKNLKDFRDIDSKVYPYLTFNYPIFEHWDGEILYSIPKKINSFKSVNKNSKFDKAKILKAQEASPYWLQVKNQINGDGIVISVCDKFIDEILKLITMLRYLGNHLPVELIYRDDLSEFNKKAIIERARNDLNLNIGNGKVSTYKYYSSNLTKQDIWFVNIAPCINKEYAQSFQGYFQKELAYIFNSFENMILMDTDIIMFKPPIELFKSNAFINTDTLFFKDRNVYMRMSDSYINDFLFNAVPSKGEQLLFDLKQIEPSTWDKEYFKEKYFHYQEAGVVVINRKKYWEGVLLTPHLSHIQSTLTASWGDKEHFWLGLFLSGIDTFEFNEYWSGSSGQLEYSKKGNWNRICSSHPSHIDQDDDSLLWINSGSLNCPIRSDDYSVEDDFEYFEKYKGFTKLNELFDYYSSIPKIFSVIIPPNSKYNDGIVEADDFPIEPHVGFQQLPLCNNRIWCAYDRIRDGSLNEYNGKVFNFETDLINWIDYIMQSYHSG